MPTYTATWHNQAFYPIHSATPNKHTKHLTHAIVCQEVERIETSRLRYSIKISIRFTTISHKTKQQKQPDDQR